MKAPAIGEVASSCTNSEWHLRYDRVADRYERTLLSPELLDALAVGLREWASLLPQTELDRHGRHKPVNSWGLGPELTALSMVQGRLELQGHVRLAARLDRMARRLLRTATHLDECYPKVSADEETAEQRLFKTCRMQAAALAGFLEDLKKTLFGVAPSAHTCVNLPSQSTTSRTPPLRKRSSRAANIETLRTEIIEHIKGTRNAIETAVRLKCRPPEPAALTAAELSQRTGLPPHTVSRCLHDDAAHELRMLWDIASNAELIMKYR